MGNITDKKFKKAEGLAKSVFNVQSKLNADRKKEIKENYKTDIAKAEQSRNQDNNYVNRRNTGLLDRKIWRNKDQISLYDITDCNNKYKYVVYYEQDKDNNPSEEQFEHMIDMEFETIEHAELVFKAMCGSFNLIMSPCTEGHILGKPYKVVTI